MRGRLGARLEAGRRVQLHLEGVSVDEQSLEMRGSAHWQARAAGRALGFADAAIAATAGSYGLTILTRNLRHFIPLGVDALDPLDTLPRLHKD